MLGTAPGEEITIAPRKPRFACTGVIPASQSPQQHLPPLWETSEMERRGCLWQTQGRCPLLQRDPNSQANTSASCTDALSQATVAFGSGSSLRRQKQIRTDLYKVSSVSKPKVSAASEK